MPTGKVKWYDADKGFGFLSQEDGEDVYVRASALPDGVEGLKAGQRVEFGVATGRRGPQALSVKLIDPPPSLVRTRREAAPAAEHKHSPDELHGMAGQTGLLSAFGQCFGNGLVGADAFLAAAQNHGVAAFNTKNSGVGGNVRPRLVDDGDYADGDATFFDDHAIGANAFGQALAHRVWKRGDFTDALEHAVKAGVGQCQAVYQC